MPTGRAVEITRTELSATELRLAAARSRDADAARRMQALALVLEGKSRKEASVGEAATHCGRDNPLAASRQLGRGDSLPAGFRFLSCGEAIVFPRGPKAVEVWQGHMEMLDG